jgi:hypothetical protein
MWTWLFLGLMIWGSGEPTVAAHTETVVFEGRPLMIQWNPETRTPLTMRSGDGVPLLEIKGIARRTRDQITLSGPLLVKKYQKFFGLQTDQLRLKGAEQVDGSWYVSYWQTVKGIIIYETSLGFSIDPQGRIQSLGAVLYPTVSFPEGFRITREQALNVARAHIPDFKKQDYALVAENVLLTPEKGPEGIRFYKVYALNFFPRRALHPASGVGGYAVFIDTQSERIIRRETLFKPLGCCVPENWTPPKPEELYKGMFGN